MSLQPAKQIPEEQSVVSAENPWPGLLSFREADQRWFQGRRDETAELVQNVKRERLTVVFALSGIGKSSLLQAGLFPALRRDDIFPVYVRLDYAPQTIDLRAQVFEAVAQAGAAADITVPSPKGGETLWEYFHSINGDFWTGQKQRVLPLLVFDQFEEIFTLGRGEHQPVSEAFLEDIADLAEGTVPDSVQRRWDKHSEDQNEYVREGEYKVLISLREDFLPEFSDQKRRIAGVPMKRYRLRQMNGEGALLAVSQAKDLVDETVAAQIVRYVADEKRVGTGRRGRPLKDLDVEPALLSVVCRELNNRRRQKSERRISADLLEGEQEDVLNDFYNRCFDGLPSQARSFVEEQLISVAGARNSVPLDNALAWPGMSAQIVEQLVERRLLRKEFRRNEVRVELTHDLLTGVVRNSRDTRRAAEALALQKKEREEALAQARRSRRLALSFAAFAVVAAAAAVFGLLGQAQARQQTLVAQDQTKKTLEESRQKELARQLATKSAEEAKAESLRADSARADAEKNAAERELARLEADKNATEAQKQTATANAATARAVAANAEAQARTAEATAAAAAEKTANAATLAAKLATDKANADLDVKNKATQKEFAQELVNTANGLVSSGQAGKALGNLARALTLDPDSPTARSLAFDQLLRGSWDGSVKPAGTGADTFVHAPLTLAGGVLSAVFSPDGRQTAVVSKDKTVQLWDWQSGGSAALPGFGGFVDSAAFSPDGKRLVIALYDGTARIWDVAGRTELHKLSHAAVVTSAVFSADGRRVVTASQDKTAQVWDVESGNKVGGPLTHPMTVNYASFSPDGRFVATACNDQRGRVWDVGSGSEVAPQLQHTGIVKSVAFSPDGKYLVTASDDHTARIWTAATHTATGDPMQHNDRVTFAAFSPDGRRIATSSWDKTARVWDAFTGRAVTAALPTGGHALSAGFSPDSRRVVTASDDNTVRVWDIWNDFANAGDLVNLLEGVGKYSGASDDIPLLPAAESKRRLDDLRAKASQQPPNGFMRWFFAHRLASAGGV